MRADLCRVSRLGRANQSRAQMEGTAGENPRIFKSAGGSHARKAHHRLSRTGLGPDHLTLMSAPAAHLSPEAKAALPRHVAIIMDGNGRWARQRHLPRIEGHRSGADSARIIIRASG